VNDKQREIDLQGVDLFIENQNGLVDCSTPSSAATSVAASRGFYPGLFPDDAKEFNAVIDAKLADCEFSDPTATEPSTSSVPANSGSPPGRGNQSPTNSAAEENPTLTVYIQIGDKSQLPQAQMLMSDLPYYGSADRVRYILPDPETVGQNKLPQTAQIRYYYREQFAVAAALQDDFQKILGPNAQILVKGPYNLVYPTAALPRDVVEFWFAQTSR